MLSYLFRLIDQFQRQHGVEPNLLYVNELHMAELKKAVAYGQNTQSISEQSISEFLKMEFIISREITHPHVAWTQAGQRMAV